jgi:hypothetical protein
MVRIVIGDEKRLTQDGLAVTVRNRSEEVGSRVGD